MVHGEEVYRKRALAQGARSAPILHDKMEPRARSTSLPTPSADTSPAEPRRKLWLAIEIALVFIALPTAYRLRMIGMPLIPAILSLASIALVVLLMDRRFDRRRFWRVDRIRREWPRIIRLFLAAASIGALAVALLTPGKFLDFVRTRPAVWLTIMALYPILSVYPQEIVFRAFFFHRYRALFGRPWALIVGSALVFGYVHIVMGSGLAMGLSAIGGVLFGFTYLRSRSLMAVAVEHALYGCFIFTVGLGRYFYLPPGG